MMDSTSEKSFINRYQIIFFFILSLFAWVIWGSQTAHKYDLIGWAPSLKSPLNALTVWAPGLAAMLLTRLTLGKNQVGTLFRPLLKWRVPIQWYLFAILFEPGKWLSAFGIDRLMGNHYELGTALLLKSFGAGAAFMIPIAIIFTLPNSLGEELGWRAFALPRLQKKYNALSASVIIGLFWGFWHIPAWFAWANSKPSFLSLLLMVLSMVPAAILFTWLYNKTNQSLLLVCIFHASSATKGYLMPKLPTLTEMIILWLVAIAVVMLGGLRNHHSPPDSSVTIAQE